MWRNVMSHALRRLLLPPLAALCFVLATASVAFAGTPVTDATVYNADGTPAGATVCQFYLVFSPVAGGETGSWALRDAAGVRVDTGAYAVTDTESDRVPDTGTFTVPNGTYELRWDSETPIDESRKQLPIVVACAAETAPIITEAPSFGQSLGAETDVPNETLPDTTATPGSGPDGFAWMTLLPLLAGLLALIMVLTPRRHASQRNR
jgi:hypothetical protein